MVNGKWYGNDKMGRDGGLCMCLGSYTHAHVICRRGKKRERERENLFAVRPSARERKFDTHTCMHKKKRGGLCLCGRVVVV